MSEQIKNTTVRLLSDGTVVGAGFLATARHVITCAHVVAQSLNIPENKVDPPDQDVVLDFPFLAPGKTQGARVVFWLPVKPSPVNDAYGWSDIAVLELKGEPPQGARAHRLLIIKDFWNHGFRTFGFPQGYDSGVFASGILKDEVADGWVMIEGEKQTGFSIQPGFSGAPVWDEKMNGVVGMIVESARERETRVAFMIPAVILAEAWPDLKEQSVPPCPYKGLCAFQEEDAPFFFGREIFAEELVEVVRDKPLVAVVGASGSGKSSVAFSGLVPQLRQDGKWLIASFRPKDRPIHMLSSCLLPLLESTLSQTRQIEEINNLTEKFFSGTITIRNVVEKIMQLNRNRSRLLLIVDQYEELYTLCREEERRRIFMDLIIDAVQEQARYQGPWLTVLITIRADFMGQALSYRPLADALQHADLKMGPMSNNELERVIVEPATKLHVALEEGLTARILESVKEKPGSLPLLEFTLTLLWEKQSGHVLTHSAFEEIGGVERSLAIHAEKVYATIDPEDRHRIRKIMMQLVLPSEGTEDTRRLAVLSEVGQANWDLITHLANERLVVTGRDEATGSETVEIVHEALIREWERFKRWIGRDRAFRTWQERLRTLMRQWENKDRDEGGLLRGVFLSEAEQWLEGRAEDISTEEQAFIKASFAMRTRLEAKELRRRRTIVTGLAVGLLIALCLAGLAGFFWKKAEDQVLIAEHQSSLSHARELLAHAGTQTGINAECSLVLALNAYDIAHNLKDTNLSTFQNTLRRSLTGSRVLKTLSFPSEVRSLDWHPGGDTIAVCLQNGKAVIWDTQADTKRHELQYEKCNVVSWRPDGRKLAVSSTGRKKSTITIWDNETGQTELPLPGLPIADKLVWSPDGEWLAASSNLIASQTSGTGQVLLLELKAARTVQLPMKKIRSLAWHPGGEVIAVADNNSIRFWNHQTQQFEGARLRIDLPMDIEWSPTGRWLAAGFDDGTVHVWDYASRQNESTLAGHTNQVIRVRWARNGNLLSSASWDGTIRIWNVTNNRHIATLTAHRSGIYDIAWNSSGSRIASASKDKTVRIWDARSGRASQLLFQTDNWMWDAAWSPDGSLVATAADDGLIRVWDSRTNQPFKRLKSNSGRQIHSLSWSSDGQRLAAAAREQSVWVWDTKTWEPVHFLDSGQNAVYDVSWSPQGNRLVSCGFSLIAPGMKLWDAMDGKGLGNLTGLFTASDWCPDGKRLALGGPGVLTIVDMEKRKVEKELAGHDKESAVWGLAWSPDGTLLASASDDNTARVWDVDAGECRRTLVGHNSDVKGVAWSPDGKQLVTASLDQTVRVWDVATGKDVAIFSGHTSGVRTVDWEPNGGRIVSAGEDGAVRLFYPRFEDILFIARAQVKHGLTTDECAGCLKNDSRIAEGAKDPNDCGCNALAVDAETTLPDAAPLTTHRATALPNQEDAIPPDVVSPTQPAMSVAIIVDPALAEKIAAPWMLYLLARAKYIEENMSQYKLEPGPIVPEFMEEVAARSLLATVWKRAKEDGGELADDYLDQLVLVIEAGFMKEYVWAYLRQEHWREEDASGLKLSAFETWRQGLLADHQSKTHGGIEFKSR